jgi:hypothetical protein
VVNRRAPIALIVFVIALAIYLFTLAPTVAMIDSGELTDAAWSLGNGHPPGFPLFVLLTHFFTLLPVHSVAWRANLASAFFSALAAAFTALAALEVLLLAPLPPGEGAAERRVRGKKRAKPLTSPPVITLSATTITLIAISAGLLLAFSRTVWRYAVETEVYALNTAMMAAIAWLMLSWSRTRRSTTLYIAAFLFGLALGVHHVTIGLGALAIAVLITRTAGVAFWRSRETVIAAVLLFAGLLIYAYIPLAASHDPAMNWGNPRTAHQVWDHATGKAYRSYLSSAGSSVSAQIDRYFDLLIRELGPPWMPIALLIAAVGLVALWRRQRTLFWYVVLLIVANLAWVLFYPVKADQDAYAIPSFLALILAFAFGARRISEWKPAAAYGVLLVPLLALVVAFPLRNRRNFWVASDYVANAMRAMGATPLLITNDWQMYSPMRYMLDVEHARPDVAIIGTGFLESDWYHDEIDKRYPEILRGCENEQRKAREQLARFNDDPSLWKDAAARGDLYDRIDDLTLAIIAHQLQRGPVYLTVDTALAWNARDKKLIDRLKREHDIVPHGIVMEVVVGHTFRDIKWTPIETRGVFDGTVQYDDDDPVPNELLPAYRAAFLTRARYLAITRHTKEAIADYQQAFALDPENSMLERELNVVQAMAH